MGLLDQNQSLKEINEIISNELTKPTIRIIGDIPITEDDFEILVKKLRLALKADFRLNARQFSESLILCLVYCAQIYFSNNDYWSHVESRFMPFSLDHRSQIRKQFSAVCLLYGLPAFEHERQLGYAIITPIICHAGIPRAQLDDFFRLFDEAVQDVEQSGWMDFSEVIYDYFEMRAPVYIRRFIDSLSENRAAFFMQWQDVTQRLYHDESTADELADELKASYESEEKILISYRFLSQYCEWRNLPIEKVFGQKARKVSFSSPRIMLNMDGMGIYIRLPQQRIQDEYPASEINWLIRSDEFQTNISCPVNFNRNEGQAYSEETSVIIKPAKQYVVELFSSDDYQKPLATWNLDLLKRNYLAFTSAGELIKADSLSGSQAILVVPEQIALKSSCQVGELSRIPYWTRFLAYTISYQPTDVISVHERLTGQLIDTILISNAAKPELVRGELLFNNPGIYTSLPFIKMPRQNALTWKVTLIKTSGRIAIPARDEWSDELSLQEIISSNEYGLFELRMQNNNGSHYQFRFHYVPTILITNDSGRWPQPFTGYHSNHIQCIMSEALEISLDHYDIEANLVYGQERRMLFKSSVSFTSVNGYIKMNNANKLLTVPFKLAIRPLIWSIVGLSTNGQVQMTANTIRQERRYLNTAQELFLLIATGDLGAPVLNSRLIAQKPNGDVILDKAIQLKSWNNFRLGLMDLLLSPELMENHRLTITLTIESPDQSIIGKFPLVIFSECLNVSSLIISKDDWSVCFDWQETGDKVDRVLICQNIGEPWQEALLFPVMDGETTLRLPHNAFRKSSYACAIEPKPDVSPFGTLEYKPANLVGKKVCTLGIENSEHILLCSFNRKMLTYLLSNNIDEPTVDISSLDNDEDVPKLAKSYLFFKQMASQINYNKNPELKERYTKALAKYHQFACGCKVSPGKIISSLLKDCFSTKQLTDLIFFFEINWLKDNQIDQNWHPSDFYTLAEACPELAFQVCISTGCFLEWIIRWIGEHDLELFLEITPEESMQTLIQQRLVEHMPALKKWGTHCNYWGSINDNFEFARYVADLKPSESRLDGTELLRNFNQKFNANKRRLFDKNYLLLLQDLKSSMNMHAEDVGKIIDYVSKLDRIRIKKFRDSYPVLMDLIENRTDYNGNTLNELAYSIGMVIFLGVLYRHGLWLEYDKPLVRYLARINRLFPEFYRHDLVLIELYLLDGGH